MKQFNGGCGTTLNDLVKFSVACLINDGDSLILTGGLEISTGVRWVHTVAQRYNLQVSFDNSL